MSAATAKGGDYEGIYKELDKLDGLSSTSSGGKISKASGSKTKSKTQSIPASLDALLASLREAKQQLAEGANSLSNVSENVSGAIEASKKEIEDRQKEVYNSLNRMGKALDKKFPEALPNYGPMFTNPEAAAALDRVIALHLLRTGSLSTAQTFIDEAKVDLGRYQVAQFQELHAIISALRAADLDPALQWCNAQRDFLQSRNSSLEFNLHRSRYIRLLLASSPSTSSSIPDVGAALSYARRYFPPLYAANSSAITRLTSAVIFLPPSRLATSPYADLTSQSIHTDLEGEFAREYCALLKMSRQPPLRVVGDLGGAGALAKIERGKKVMLDKKTEWTASDELPIEIEVPRENRYHSIFACPVSKEQATDLNPPMMLSCGHVLAKDSVTKLAKNGGNGQQRVKCPYCPKESNTPALRVWF